MAKASEAIATRLRKVRSVSADSTIAGIVNEIERMRHTQRALILSQMVSAYKLDLDKAQHAEFEKACKNFLDGVYSPQEFWIQYHKIVPVKCEKLYFIDYLLKALMGQDF